MKKESRFLYNWDGKKQGYHIDIVTEDWPRIYANGKQISLDELHSGDLVMLYVRNIQSSRSKMD